MVLKRATSYLFISCFFFSTNSHALGLADAISLAHENDIRQINHWFDR